MELRIYLRMLQRSWWVVILTALIAVNAALIASYFTPPTYRASARFVVSPNPGQITGGDIFSSLDVLDKRSIIATYAEFMNSNRVYIEALQDLNLQPTNLLDYKHTTIVLPDANILELTVDGPDAKTTAMLTNTIGQRAISYIRGIYQVFDISMLDPAAIPVVPITPQPLRDSLLALVLGLVLGAALAILREQMQMPLDAYRQRNMIDKTSMAYTRRYFTRQLETEAVNNPNETYSLGLVQLEGLLELVDNLPQPIMQTILTRITGILRKELRGNDLIGRWSDASFAMLLPATSEAAANRTMERIRQSLSVPLEIESNTEPFILRPRIGFATHKSNESAQELTERVEMSLDKSSGS